MMKKIVLILLLSAGFSLMSLSATADANKIVKWKDSNGVTHYGDKLPSQESGRNNTELRNNGIVIKQNIKFEPTTQDQQKLQEKLAQQHADKVLLASYTSAKEIDLACERNLETDQAALESLIQQQRVILSKTIRNKKIEQGFITKNVSIPAHLSQELKQSQSEIDRTNKQIEKYKQTMVATRKRYTEEKNRFVVIKQSDSHSTEPAMASLNVQ